MSTKIINEIKCCFEEKINEQKHHRFKAHAHALTLKVIHFQSINKSNDKLNNNEYIIMFIDFLRYKSYA